MSKTASRICSYALIGSSLTGCAGSQSTIPAANGGVRRNVLTTNVSIAIDERPLDATELVKKEVETASRLGASQVQILASDGGTEGDRIGGYVAVCKD